MTERAALPARLREAADKTYQGRLLIEAAAYIETSIEATLRIRAEADLSAARSTIAKQAQEVQRLRMALASIVDLKDEAYADEPVSHIVADVVARNAGRIILGALDQAPVEPSVERCQCGVVSRGLVDGLCANCRDMGVCVDCGGQYSDLAGHREHAHPSALRALGGEPTG